MPRRTGITLIECLVVVAITGVTLALSLAALQRAREAAVRAQSLNQLRQVNLAVNQFAAAFRERLPSLDGGAMSANKDMSMFWAILPYLDQGIGYEKLRLEPAGVLPVDIFMSPADPTVRDGLAKGRVAASYAANAMVFRGAPSVVRTFRDGASNTITFGEHYAFNCRGVLYFPFFHNPGFGHRASFADHLDVAPVTSGSPPVSLPNTGAKIPTFQAAPALKDCDPHLPQTPHASGMLTAMGDGSARILAPSVSPMSFWSAVTPSAGDALAEPW